MTTIDNRPDLTGIGDHLPDNRRGFLVFSRLPEAIQRAEDSTQAADYDNRSWRASVHRDRPSTPVERALLAYTLGHAVPRTLVTRVRWLSDGVRNRSWPALGIRENGAIEWQ